MNENQSVRLTRTEREYFENYWKGTFSSWVHNKVKEELKKIDGSILKNKFQNYAYSMVMMSIGAMFWFFTASMDNFGSIAIVFIIGLFLIITGGVTLILEVKKHG